LPVGNSSQGVGLFPGEVMLNMDLNFQKIIWSHDPLPYENFVHKGLLNSTTINPRFTIGISERFNITVSQAIGVRKMIWESDAVSIHHRSEDTSTDFRRSYDNSIQAKGGIFGDTKIQIKYLYKDIGMKEGSRIYFGFGITSPSKAVLRSDPFKKPQDTSDINEWLSGKYDHRHFSLSNGVYKGSLEIQLFNKKFSNPIFYGAVFNIDIPFSPSKYGYLPGLNYSISSSIVFERSSFVNDQFNIFPAGFLYGLSFIGFEEASWNDIPSPNSKSRMLIPSIGGIWLTKKGSVSLSFQKPFFIEGRNIMVGIDTVSNDPLNNKTNAFEILFGYRRNLGYMIPWL
tara:strand:- start:735 stop:1760 length:1026 start_codon:yes stop_codon:yes gene_type:complete